MSASRANRARRARRLTTALPIFTRRRSEPSPERTDESSRLRVPELEPDLLDVGVGFEDQHGRQLLARIVDDLAERGVRALQLALEMSR